MDSLCLKCKGRNFCGKPCKVLAKYSSHKKTLAHIKDKEFIGSSPPSIFVSWHNYPNITIAPMLPTTVLKDADFLDNPERWFGLESEKIVEFRETMVRSNVPVNVKSAADPSYELSEIQEITLAKKQIDLEIKLQRVPIPKVSYSNFNAPLGPTARMEKMELVSNPSVYKKLDYIVSDDDVKSRTAIDELYSKRIPVNSIMKVLSSGLLGVKKNRRLVPTRWAITAIDDTVSKIHVEKLTGYSTIDSWQLFHSKYLENNYWILLTPTTWMFEVLEAWGPNTPWTQDSKTLQISQDFEFYDGRKKYASNVQGGYYAARGAVTEYLLKQKRQAGCIIFREIGDYDAPLGVWQCRENVRNAIKQIPKNFSDLKLVLKFLESKLKLEMKYWKKESELLDNLTKQKRIFEYF